MKLNKLTYSLLFLTGVAQGFDTYHLRIPLTTPDQITTISYDFKGKGQDGGGQPFFGTYLVPATTSYQRVYITPSNDTEMGWVKSNLGVPGAAIEVIYRLDKFGEPYVSEDHRKEFQDPIISTVAVSFSVDKST